ncbi:RING finger protein 4 isoform X6 [Hippoglossus stenolepis]|uniref:RING finger protein 4 isoform X6 n=1 Tax=Hippoglossus stenolepis TaxID=195615 RepID=UPI00159C33FC|nr:RING finger protein 4 isoform X6 [Hippoglossus stenolepis]
MSSLFQAHRKRRSTGSPVRSRPSTKNSRAANANRVASRMADVSSTPDGDTPPSTETIDVMDNAEDSVEEVVDLTCEGSEAAVVDLTNNDSVLVTTSQLVSQSTSQSTSQLVYWWTKVLRTGESPQVRVTSSAVMKTRIRSLSSTLPPCPLCTPPGRLRGRSVVLFVWTRTLRL